MSETDLTAGGRASEETRRPIPFGDLIFSFSGMIAGIVVIVSATGIRIPSGSTNVIDSRAFPYAVGAMLIVASLAVVIGTLRGKRGQAEEGEDVDENASTDWVTVAVLAILFTVFGILIQPLGWPVAVLILFGGTAWKLGAKRWWMALIVGLIVGLITQLIFGTMLGISLPAGPLFEWIPIFGG